MNVVVVFHIDLNVRVNIKDEDERVSLLYVVYSINRCVIVYSEVAPHTGMPCVAPARMRVPGTRANGMLARSRWS